MLVYKASDSVHYPGETKMNELEYQEDEGTKRMGYGLTSRTVEAIEDKNEKRDYALSEDEIATLYGEDVDQCQQYDEDLDPHGELTEATLEAIESPTRSQINNGMTSD